MKIILFFLWAVFLPLCSAAQVGYFITGHLKNSSGRKVYLGNKGFMVNENVKRYFFLDSCIAVNDRFEFKGRLRDKGIYSISMANSDSWQSFLIDTDTISIEGHADSIYRSTISKSRENAAYKAFNSLYEKRIWRMFDVAQDSAWVTGERGDTAAMRLYDEDKRFHQEQMVRSIKKFISEHPDNFYSAQLLIKYEFFLNQQESKELFLSLSEALQNNSNLEGLRVKINEPGDLKNGDASVDFSMSDNRGRMVNTAAYRGKYLLINFWASWCIPCRAEMPQLIELYKRFNGQGFEVISYSIDINREKWLKAIQDVKMPWTNLSDLKGEDGRVQTIYNARAVPRNVLIGKTGEILQVNVEVRNLEAEISKLFQ